MRQDRVATVEPGGLESDEIGRDGTEDVGLVRDLGGGDARTHQAFGARGVQAKDRPRLAGVATGRPTSPAMRTRRATSWALLSASWPLW